MLYIVLAYLMLFAALSNENDNAQCYIGKTKRNLALRVQEHVE